MIELKSFILSPSKEKVTYQYVVSKKYQKYFSESLYVDFKENIYNVPNSIINIPAITNLVVICWFLDCDFFIDEMDVELYNSLLEIQKEMKIMHPQITDRNVITYNKLIPLKISNVSKSLTLFSGGVDAFATLFRHYDESPILVRVFGDKMDNKSFEKAIDEEKQYNSEELLDKNEKKYIVSNLRTFYSDKLNKLPQNGGWWSDVQHGYALTTLLAPLAFKYEVGTIYIASSYTDNIKIAWGSTPEIDNKISWSGTHVIHDGYELKRQEKIDLISNFTKDLNKGVVLRVCYSPINKYTNCSKCEKCRRTIFGLVLSGANPNNYGFKVGPEFYDELIYDLNKGFKSEGVQYFWKEIYDKLKNTSKAYYIFDDINIEGNKLNEIQSLLKIKVTEPIPKDNSLVLAKRKFISMFPGLFKMYLKFRIALIKRKL
ncbi:hypothetical protein [Aequorivita sinensis]|uniref:hypothetical protein n=1 Tax=Aequorivita sinensis TaxID=1382458 RepID=UPI00111FF7D2|nr:hypothetical protein [Aequorivita sinensis]